MDEISLAEAITGESREYIPAVKTGKITRPEEESEARKLLGLIGRKEPTGEEVRETMARTRELTEAASGAMGAPGAGMFTRAQDARKIIGNLFKELPLPAAKDFAQQYSRYLGRVGKRGLEYIWGSWDLPRDVRYAISPGTAGIQWPKGLPLTFESKAQLTKLGYSPKTIKAIDAELRKGGKVISHPLEEKGAAEYLNTNIHERFHNMMERMGVLNTRATTDINEKKVLDMTKEMMHYIRDPQKASTPLVDQFLQDYYTRFPKSSYQFRSSIDWGGTTVGKPAGGKRNVNLLKDSFLYKEPTPAYKKEATQALTQKEKRWLSKEQKLESKMYPDFVKELREKYFGKSLEKIK